MAQFEHQAQQLVDAAKNGRIPEQVRMVAEESVKRVHEAYINLNSAAQEGTQSWERILHANYETARKIGRKWLQNTATNVDAAFAAARSIAAAHTVPDAAQLYAKFVQQQLSAGSLQIQESLALAQHVGATDSGTDKDFG
jgi:hypothetical protein